MIKDKGNRVQLDVIIEKYKNKKVVVKDIEGNVVLQESGKPLKEIVEEYNGFFLLPTTFYKEGLTIYSPLTNIKNKILKTRSTVYDKYSNKFYMVKHPIEEIENTLHGVKQVGFQISK